MENNRFCIYAVDDDEDDRILIKTALADYSDCEVTFFENGQALLSKLANSPADALPTLILLDLDMPQVDGYDVLQTLGANSPLRAIPVLVLSGNRSEQIVRRAYQLGANSFMSKPHNFGDFKRMISLTYEYWLKTAHTPGNP